MFYLRRLCDIMTAIKKHMTSIVATTSSFDDRLQDIDDKIQILMQQVKISGDENSDNITNEHDQLQDEKESIAQWPKICAHSSSDVSHNLHKPSGIKANLRVTDPAELQDGPMSKSSKPACEGVQCRRAEGENNTNIVKDVLAARESCQIIVVASEHLLSAVGVTAEAGATQWIGHMSKCTLEGLLRGRDEVHRIQSEVEKS